MAKLQIQQSAENIIKSKIRDNVGIMGGDWNSIQRELPLELMIPSLGKGTVYPTLYQSYDGHALVFIQREFPIKEYVVLKASRFGTGFFDGMYIGDVDEALAELELQGSRQRKRDSFPMLDSTGELIPEEPKRTV